MQIRKKQRLIEKVSLLILTLSFCEFLYAKTTGEKTSVVLAILLTWGVISFLFCSRKLTKDMLWKALIIVVIAVYSRNEQGLRYAMTLAALMLWSKIHFFHMEKYVRFLVIVSGIFGIMQLMGGTGRIYGFFASSAPQMSCVFFICECFLLVCMANNGFNKLDIVLAVACVAFNFFTGTRTTLIASAILFLLYIVVISMNASKFSSKKAILFILVAVAGGIIVVNQDTLLSYVNAKISRNDLQASSLTRVGIYRFVWSQISSSFKTFLIGNRGGFIKESLMQYLSKTFYYPAHQDYLLIWAEYGIVGLSVLFWTFLRRHRKYLYFVMVFSVCSFHNVILTPMTMILMVITMCHIENKNYVLLTKNSRRTKTEIIAEKGYKK